MKRFECHPERSARAQADRRGRLHPPTWSDADTDPPLTEAKARGTLLKLSMSWTCDNVLCRDVRTARDGPTVLQGVDSDDERVVAVPNAKTGNARVRTYV